jgi:hypothetical protein
MTSELETLARANPVPAPYEEDADAAGALLARILAEPRVVARPRSRRRRRGVAVAVACGALAAWALLGSGTGSDRVPHLASAERAYAAVLPGEDVIHEVVSSAWSVGGKPRGREHYEAWYRPSTGQAVRVTGGDEGAVRVMITRHGTVLVESSDTRLLTGRSGLVEMDNPTTPAFRARNRQDFAAAFRDAYDRDQLADRGLTTFDGLPAHRFSVVKGLDGIDALDFYADPQTGRPLGSVERIGTQVNVRRLTTWERLKPNHDTLARLDIR